MKESDMERSCNTFEIDENYIQSLSGNSDVKLSCGRPVNSWEANIKMD
jgi:hypothetical protein